MKIDYTVLTKIGREWHKDNMHRFYIDLAAADEVAYNAPEDVLCGRLPMNRHERMNGKVWIDMENGEIETKNIRSAEDMIDCIRKLLAYLGAEIVEEEEIIEDTTDAEEATEETVPAPWYAVLYDCEDNDWGTGSYDLEEAKKMALRYRADGWPEAFIAVIDESGPDAFCLDVIHDINPDSEE